MARTRTERLLLDVPTTPKLCMPTVAQDSPEAVSVSTLAAYRNEVLLRAGYERVCEGM